MPKQSKQKISFLDYIVDKYGSDFVVSDECQILKLDSIPTGSIALDFSLGVGGIPQGRFSELDGPESVGKSTLALSIASNCIRQGGKVLYIDVENTMSYDYIRALVDQDFSLDNILLVQPETAEEAFEIAERGIQSKEFRLIIFDSIGGLAPQKEKEDEFTDANVALVPRLLSKFLRRTAFDVRNNNVAFLFLNQVRDNIGSYVRSYTLPGGHALKHFCSIMVSMSKGEQIKFGDDIVGITSKFTVKKNKLAPPFRSFFLSIFFGKGIDTVRDLVDFGITMGVLQKGGPYIKYKDEVIGKGTVNAVEYLGEHKEIFEAVKNELMALSSTKVENVIEDDEEE
jgi:recombination protein RecA